MNLGTWLIEEEQGDTCKETRFFSERRALAFIHQCLPSTCSVPWEYRDERGGELHGVGEADDQRRMASGSQSLCLVINLWRNEWEAHAEIGGKRPFEGRPPPTPMWRAGEPSRCDAPPGDPAGHVRGGDSDSTDGVSGQRSQTWGLWQRSWIFTVSVVRRSHRKVLRREGHGLTCMFLKIIFKI